MENVEIATVLDEVADLLEIQGDNPFRVRAYRNAVRTISNLTRPVEEMIAGGDDLTSLPGIGRDLAAHITELVDSGHLERLVALEKQVPPSLARLLRIEGLGPRRARLLHDELGIRSLDDLVEALDAGRVEALKGFGPKSVENLRRGLDELRKAPPRIRLADADQLVRPLLLHLEGSSGVEKVEVAGSYRRRRETVGDVDILAVCADPGPVMRHFVGYPEVARVQASGSTRGTVLLRSGLQVDLRILPPESYGAALHYFTGSKAHNIAVRRLGMEKGLRISEYGVFRMPKKAGGKPARRGGAEERDVYDAVGMQWVPPELREDRGEIGAAMEDRLPRLMRLEEIRGDLQMHSTWSDGRDSIEAMALAAADLGYEYLAITDHSRAVRVAGGLSVEELEEQWKEIASVRRKLGGRIHLFRGLEVDILRDGSLDLPDEYLSRLDVVVVSVHSHLGLSKKAMTERVIRGISHPSVHILAHPTGRLINRRRPIALDLEAVLKAAAELDVAVEINAQPDRLDLDDVQARRARDLGVKIVIDTDAHTAGTLGFMRHGVDQARRGWLEKDDVLNTRPLEAMEAWLTRGRGESTTRRRGKRPTAKAAAAASS